MRSLGMQHLGMRPLGMRPLGMRPLGMRTLGMRPLGMRPLGMWPPGMRPLGMRPLGPGYAVPGYATPRYATSGYATPGYAAPGSADPLKLQILPIETFSFLQLESLPLTCLPSLNVGPNWSHCPKHWYCATKYFLVLRNIFLFYWQTLIRFSLKTRLFLSITSLVCTSSRTLCLCTCHIALRLSGWKWGESWGVTYPNYQTYLLISIDVHEYIWSPIELISSPDSRDTL